MDDENEEGFGSRPGGVGSGSSGGDRGEGIIKKQTFTEKLTGVKNSKADQILKQRNLNIDREKARQLRILHENRSNIRHEFKIMQFDRKKNDLELKKRSNPCDSYQFEEAGVAMSERYLKEPVEGFYLQKHNAIRRRSVGDPSAVTPMVAKARETLRQSELSKQIERQRSEMGLFSRHDSEPEINRDTLMTKRPRSKSISIDALSLTSQYSNGSSVDRQHRDKMQRKGSPNTPVQSAAKPNIDVTVIDLGTSNASKVQAKHPVTPGLTRTYTENAKCQLPNIQGEKIRGDKKSLDGTPLTQNSLQRDPYLLKAKSDCGTSQGKPHVSFNINNNDTRQKNSPRVRDGQPESYSAMRRKSLGGTPQFRRPLTQEVLREESCSIQQKIEKFFQSLDETKRKEIEKEAANNEPDILQVLSENSKSPDAFRTHRFNARQIVPPTSQNMDEAVGVQNQEANDVIKEPECTSSSQETDVNSGNTSSPQKTLISSQWKLATDKVTEIIRSQENVSPEMSWEAAPKTRRESIISLTGSESAICTSPSPQSMQRRRSSVPGIPMHSMQRSQRHSATFKLRKLVMDLMKEKTRYELNELQELKRCMVSEQAEQEQEQTESENKE